MKRESYSPAAYAVHTAEIDVLIVGSGPAGSSAALTLSTDDVPNIVVTRHASLADAPRAHITNQGNEPLAQAEHELASPSHMCDMPQHLMEPVLADVAVARGTSLRFETEYLLHVQDADGVTATVRDRLRGDTYEIRAKYLIGGRRRP